MHNDLNHSQLKSAVYSMRIIRDNYSKTPLPKNYANLTKLDIEKVKGNPLGLDKLQAIGSAQISASQFEEVVKSMPGKTIMVIDLRMESHWLVNGKPYSWYKKDNVANVGKSSKQIKADEQARIEILRSQGAMKYQGRNHEHQKANFEKSIKTIESEKAMVERLGGRYRRIHVQDHKRPSDDQVQAYINLFKNQPQDVVYLTHCKAGKGRRTTFIVMLDMWHNAHQVSFEDILYRHFCMTGKNLANLSDGDTSHKRYQGDVERLEMLKTFYQYAIDKPDMGWHDYVIQQPLLDPKCLFTPHYKDVTEEAKPDCSLKRQQTSKPIGETKEVQKYML